MSNEQTKDNTVLGPGEPPSPRPESLRESDRGLHWHEIAIITLLFVPAFIIAVWTLIFEPSFPMEFQVIVP